MSQSHAVTMSDEDNVLWLISAIHQFGRWLMTLMACSKETAEEFCWLFALNNVNPFAHNKVVDSMWPIMLTLLVNNLKSVFQYSGGWSNRTKESQSLVPYLDILVN